MNRILDSTLICYDLFMIKYDGSDRSGRVLNFPISTFKIKMKEQTNRGIL
jgi:hypothetical protein